MTETEIPREATGFEDEALVERSETGLRLLKSLVFYVIFGVVEVVLVVLVVFELLYALITRREPGPEVRRFGRRTLDYLAEIVRYTTYNQDEAPFPFRSFPEDPPRAAERAE